MHGTYNIKFPQLLMKFPIFYRTERLITMVTKAHQLSLSGVKLIQSTLFSPVHDTCPSHLILLHLSTLTTSGGQYKSCSYSVCNFLPPPVTSSLINPSLSVSTLFSNTLSLCFSLNVSDQVSHPHLTY
jgi:hypothetical protein